MEKGDAKVSTGKLMFGATDPLPLRILIIGNFDGTDISNPEHIVPTLKSRAYPTLRSIGSSNLNAYFASLNIDVSIHLDDFFTDDAPDACIRFKPHSINDFSPANLLESVPEFRALKIARDKVLDLSDEKINEEQFLSELSAYRHIKPLLMLGQDVLELSARDTDQFGARQISSRYKCVSQAIDLIIDMELSKFLHHPVIQELESQWRGLKFLTDRISKNAQIQIDCLNTSRTELLKSFSHFVIDNSVRPDNFSPYSVFVSTFTVNNTSEQLDELQSLAERVEVLQIPLIFSLSHEFFGLSIDDLAYCELNAIELLEGEQYQQWNQLRKNTSSRWLSAVYNNFLLRNQYEPGMRNVSGVTERTNRLSHYLWGNPSLFLAHLMIRSFEMTQWADNIAGREHGRIDDLPLITNQVFGQDDSFQSLVIPVNIEQAEDFATQGITCLSCTTGEDGVYIYYVPCLFNTAVISKDQLQELSGTTNNLSYQMLFSRFAHQVRRHYEKLTQITDQAVLKSAVTTILQSLVSSTGDGASLGVNVTHTEGDNQHHIVSIRATTGNKVLTGSQIEFGIQV